MTTPAKRMDKFAIRFTYLEHRVGAGGCSVRACSLLRPALVSLVEKVHDFFRGSGFHLSESRDRWALIEL